MGSLTSYDAGPVWSECEPSPRQCRAPSGGVRGASCWTRSSSSWRRSPRSGSPCCRWRSRPCASAGTRSGSPSCSGWCSPTWCCRASIASSRSSTSRTTSSAAPAPVTASSATPPEHRTARPRGVAARGTAHRGLDQGPTTSSLGSGLKIVASTLRRKSYDEAPVSPLLLFGRQQDFAYQQEVAGNPAKRHHVRFGARPKAGSSRVASPSSGWRPARSTGRSASRSSRCR